MFHRTPRLVVLLVLSSVIAIPHPAWAGKTAFTYLDVARTKTVYSVAVAPNGKHIAYRLAVPRIPFKDKDGSAWTELHVVDTKGTSRPFVTGKVHIRNIVWTPDSRMIVYLSKRSGDEHASIYGIPIDGGESKTLHSHSTAISGFDLSPDGTKIAFLAKKKEASRQTRAKKKGFSQELYEENRPCTRVWIAALHDPDKGAKQVVLKGSASAIQWSPDSKRLAVMAAPSPGVDDQYMKSRAHIVRVDTRQVERVLETEGKLDRFRWSPDGRHLALIAGQDRHDPRAGRVVVANVRTGALHEILEDRQWHASQAVWTGRASLLIMAQEGVHSTVVRVNADGSNAKTLIPAKNTAFSQMSVSKDGRTLAFSGSRPTHASEVFVYQQRNKTLKRLTNHNVWLKDRQVGTQEVITWTARDGVELQGILIRPVNEQRGQRYPLILQVHGGPENHFRNGWVTGYSRAGQLAANRGFAVFYPNYRGSTGRGLAFSKLSQGDPAGKEFDDLVDAVDHLVANGLVDTKRVGITGGSYGGYATAWGSTYYSERFAAGVMFVGLSDLISKFGTTDIPEEMYLVHARFRLWDDWQKALERSPIYHVQKGKTPLLILHGKADTRVHPGQSMELYRHLKTLGKVPVRLVLYPGEGHGNRRAASRLDFNMRMIRWMERYLKRDLSKPTPGVPVEALDYQRALEPDSTPARKSR